MLLATLFNLCALHSGTNVGQLVRQPIIHAAMSVAACDEVVDRLWASAKSPLLRVGKSGAAPSHANGLLDLCSSHSTVSVRLTGHSTQASLDQLVELIAAASDESPPLTLLGTRKPRKGGMEALFSQAGRVDELCSIEYHDRVAEAAGLAAEAEAAEAITFKAEREARAARQAARLDKASSKRGEPRMRRRAGRPGMMAMAYASVDELKTAIGEYMAGLPAGAADDPSLPSPLNYNELNYNGRPDLVEGCMAHGGYLALSNELGIPVRIGVERPAGAQAKGAQASGASVAKKAIDLFNMFGKSG